MCLIRIGAAAAYVGRGRSTGHTKLQPRAYIQPKDEKQAQAALFTQRQETWSCRKAF